MISNYLIGNAQYRFVLHNINIELERGLCLSNGSYKGTNANIGDVTRSVWLDNADNVLSLSK